MRDITRSEKEKKKYYLPALYSKFPSKLWPPVPALDHGLHLLGLDHAAVGLSQLGEGRLDVRLLHTSGAVSGRWRSTLIPHLNPPASVLHQDCTVAEFLGVERRRGCTRTEECN